MWLNENHRSHPDQYPEVDDTRPEVESISKSEPDKVKLEQIPKGGTIRKWADKLDTMMGFN